MEAPLGLGGRRRGFPALPSSGNGSLGPAWAVSGCPPLLGDCFLRPLTLQRSLLQWDQTGAGGGGEGGRRQIAWDGDAARAASAGQRALGGPYGVCFPQPGGGRLSRRSPDSLREKGMKTWARGPFALRVLSARFQLLRTESLARFQGGKNPSPNGVSAA